MWDATFYNLPIEKMQSEYTNLRCDNTTTNELDSSWCLCSSGTQPDFGHREWNRNQYHRLAPEVCGWDLDVEVRTGFHHHTRNFTSSGSVVRGCAQRVGGRDGNGGHANAQTLKKWATQGCLASGEAMQAPLSVEKWVAM